MPSAAPIEDRRQGGEEQGDRGDAEHGDDHVTKRECGSPGQLLLGERRAAQAHRAGSRARAQQQAALGVANGGDDEYGEQHERHDGHQLGEQQVGTPDRPDQQVAQACRSDFRRRWRRHRGRPRRSAAAAVARLRARRAGTVCRR